MKYNRIPLNMLKLQRIKRVHNGLEVKNFSTIKKLGSNCITIIPFYKTITNNYLNFTEIDVDL